MMQQPPQAMEANLPQIEVVRVKRIDPAAPRFQFRLSDGVVDLMKAFSLDSFEGIGSAWKMEADGNIRRALRSMVRPRTRHY